MASSEHSSIKQKRVTKACDFCHRRGRRCKITPNEEGRCLTCIEHGVACTWNRISAKRGTKSRQLKVIDQDWVLNDQKHGSLSLLSSLLDNFFESVYPVAIFVHEQAFMEDWRRGMVPSTRASYARLMSMCALSAYRIKSGATFTAQTVHEDVDSSFYLQEALRAIPTSFGKSLEFEYLQAIGIVCLTAQESINVSLLQQYLGLYHGALADQGFHYERRWPEDITPIEREERRRLYWLMYRLEVHASLIFGHAVRCPELQSAVAYPMLRDEDFTCSVQDFEWLSGWNFVTDIYRGMEHLISYFRSQRMAVSQENRNLSTAFFLDYEPRERILDPLAVALRALPDRFIHATAVSRDVRRNRCVFQTANIICTYQLLRMLSFTASDTTFHEACQTALELIEEISAIPHEVMRAMGLAMLQELSGLGHILSSFIKKELPRSDYQHLRTVMVCMAELLEILPSCLSAAVDASQRLRAYVDKIDQFLDRTQSPKPTPTEDMYNYFGPSYSHQTDANGTVIPFELLQQIPWDWGETSQTFQLHDQFQLSHFRNAA